MAKRAAFPFSFFFVPIRENSMNRLSLYLAGGAVLMLAGVASSKPIDRRAYDVLQIAKAVAARDNDKQLSDKQLQSVLEASQVDSPIVRMAAAYALAFTDSDLAKKALAALAGSDDPDVAGVAGFSLLIRQTSILKGQELLSVLSFRLGESRQPWARTLLISKLGDQFKGLATPLFLTALETEKDSLVRTELLFQIACYGNSAQLKGVKLLLDKKQTGTAAGFDETTESFLNAVSRSPLERNAAIPFSAFLREIIDTRIKAIGPDPRPK
jgi:HEAT repeat protein